MLSNNWSRLLGSPSASSLRANVFTRKAIFNKELIFKSSPAPSALPISSLLRLALISCNPENDTLPFCHTSDRASAVSFCKFFILFKSDIGSSLRHFSFPSSEHAQSESLSIILLYSRVFKTFLFMIILQFLYLNS